MLHLRGSGSLPAADLPIGREVDGSAGHPIVPPGWGESLGGYQVVRWAAGSREGGCGSGPPLQAAAGAPLEDMGAPLDIIVAQLMPLLLWSGQAVYWVEPTAHLSSLMGSMGGMSAPNGTVAWWQEIEGQGEGSGGLLKTPGRGRSSAIEGGPVSVEGRRGRRLTQEDGACQ